MKNIATINLAFNLEAIKEIENTVKSLKRLYNQNVITLSVYHKIKHQLACESSSLYATRGILKVQQHKQILAAREKQNQERATKEAQMLTEIRSKLTKEERELLKLY